MGEDSSEHAGNCAQGFLSGKVPLMLPAQDKLHDLFDRVASL